MIGENVSSFIGHGSNHGHSGIFILYRFITFGVASVLAADVLFLFVSAVTISQIKF